jgi:hypothetical protein
MSRPINILSGSNLIGKLQIELYDEPLSSFAFNFNLRRYTTDIPDVGAGHVDAAVRLLDRHDVVFGPAMDGGYYLLGVKRHEAEGGGGSSDGVWPGSYCSQRHRMPCVLRNEGSNCASMTWRAMGLADISRQFIVCCLA